MKILGIANSFSLSGAPRALLRLLGNLQLRGHEVAVTFLYRNADVSSLRLRTQVLVANPKPTPLQYALMPLRVFRHIRDERPDAVISFLPLANAVGLSMAALAGVKTRIASQRVPADTFGKVVAIADRWAGSLGAYTEVTCVSGAVADSFRNYPASYRKRLKVIHNGIEFVPSRLDRGAARASFGVGPDDFVLAALGRLNPQKNYGVLLEGLKGITGVQCIIAGDGRIREQVEGQIRDFGVGNSVRLVGNLTPERVADLLAAADVFVQPSLFEGQSNALLEAMTQGLPSIVGDIPEQRETVLDHASGRSAAIICGVDDPSAWHAAIRSLMRDAGVRQRLGQAAKDIVADRFTLKRMIDGFEASLMRSGQS